MENPIKNYDVFYQEYVENDLSLRAIAKKYCIGLRTVARWRKRHEIKGRRPGQWCGGKSRSGTSNSAWKHGNGGMNSFCVDCGKQVLTGVARCTDCKGMLYRGRGNPNYKGLADVMILVRAWVSSNWRFRVFERDGFVCQRCGDDSGGNLCAHHIKRLTVIVGELLDGVLLDTAEKRLGAVEEVVTSDEIGDLSNGVTLCKECHEAVHLGTRQDVVLW